MSRQKENGNNRKGCRCCWHSRLDRNAHAARGKLNMQVARMKVLVHSEWMEELDAWGKRLQVEVKEVQTELAEISRLNAEHEEANDVLWKELEELEVLEK